MTYTFPPRRIVAAFDGSVPGLAALRTAVRLAQVSGASLEAVYANSPTVAVPYSYDGFDAHAAAAILRESLRFKDEWRAKARAETSSLPVSRVRLTWLEGWPAESVLARARSADLLVCGTHGRSGVRRLFLGSVAEQLVRRSPVPVLCVHERAALSGPILAPYNLRAYADAALTLALELGRSLRRRVTALYVADEDERPAQARLELAARLEARLGDGPSRAATCKVRRGDPRVEIAKEAARGGYGLVVLSSHVKPTIADRTLGSTAERLLRKTHVAVLALPAGAAARPGRGAGPGALRKAVGSRRVSGARRGRGRTAWTATSRSR